MAQLPDGLCLWMLIRDESITDLLTRILRSRGLCTYSAACCKVATCSSFSFPVKCHQHMRIKLAEFILARSLRNGTKNTRGPLCVCTPHMQSIDPSLHLCKEQPILAYMGIGRGSSTIMAKRCNLERIALSALKTIKRVPSSPYCVILLRNAFSAKSNSSLISNFMLHSCVSASVSSPSALQNNNYPINSGTINIIQKCNMETFDPCWSQIVARLEIYNPILKLKKQSEQAIFMKHQSL